MIGVATSLAWLSLFLASAPAAPGAPRLPLGPPGLGERYATATLAPGVTWTRISRGHALGGGLSGPWRVNVLRVARGAPGGRLAVALSGGLVPGREPLDAMARRARALAAVNGGYFASGGVLDGDPVGALAVGRRLVSEPVGGRGSLLLRVAPEGRPLIASLRFAGSVTSGGSRRLLDGVDRPRGLIAGCGGRGGDRPTERPDPALVCTDLSELMLFTPTYGARTRTPGGGVEAVVRDGTVMALRGGGNSTIPRNGYVLSGSGDAAGFLRTRAGPGTRPRVGLALRAGSRLLQPEAFGGIVSGGPRLLESGRIAPLRPGARDLPPSYHVLRGPHTMVGVTAGGDVLLVAVDGRAPGCSAGVTLAEAARLMRALGARDALNLDGGGSDDDDRGRPSDEPSQRPGRRPIDQRRAARGASMT
jgi:hypothetical protein